MPHQVTFALCLSFLLTSAEGKNVSYYCLDDDDAPGMFIPDPISGKDSNYAGLESQYLETTTQSIIIIDNRTTYSGWSLLSSINGSNHIKQPVVDQRWEKFHGNHYDDRYVQEVMDTYQSNVFFSVRWYGEKNVTYFNKSQWYHLMTNESKLYFCDGSNCTTLLEWKQTNKDFYIESACYGALWKIHNYYYLHTTREKTGTIYEIKENCIKTYPGKGCFSFYLAMCKDCKIEVQLISQTNSSLIAKNFIGNGTWIKEHISLENLTHTCFNISAKTYRTNTTSDAFWAIGDTVYVSSKYSCKDNKRFMNVTTVPNLNLTNSFCETATNKKIYLTTDLPVSNHQNTSNTERSQKKSSLNPLYLISILLALIVIAMGPIIYCSIKRKAKHSLKRNRSKFRASRHVNFNNSTSEELQLLYQLDNLPARDKWEPVRGTDFHNYVRYLFDTNCSELLRQYSQLPSDYLSASKEGRKRKNAARNKFKEIYPYDQNRVKLRNWLSDYINASYIQGFSNYRQYIAAQSPLKNTIQDFWAMVWQDNVVHVVMVTQKCKKYVQYWPQPNQVIVYSGIQIILEEVQNYGSYKQRKFLIKKDDQTRQVNQLHFFDWDDNELLESPQKILLFIDEVLKIPHCFSPVVFHSSAGIGRSATVLLCDIVLRALPVAGTIDLYYFTEMLRKSRVNMIPSLNQYKLAHLIVNEVLKNKRELSKVPS